jgi:hypothetical protein
MDKNIYPNDTVGRYFNEKFVSVKIQMDTSKSDIEFIKEWYADASMLQRKYKVGAFPTYLFFSPNGDIVHRDVGVFGAQKFVTVGIDAMNSDKQYYTALEKYRRNELDTAYMKGLARKVKTNEGEVMAHKIANDYINRLPLDALFTIDNIQFLYEFTKTSKDRGFKLFRDYAKRISEVEKKMEEKFSKNLVLNIIYREQIKPFTTTKNGKADWKKIRSNIKKYESLGEEAFTRYQPRIIFKTEIEPELKVNAEWNHILSLIEKQKLGKNAEFVVGSTVIYYLNAIGVHHTEKNCKNLVASATYYAESFPTFLSANALNDWAYTLFENSNDKDELRKALEWSKRSNELQPASPELMDTYANVYYKLGFVDEAIIWQKKAVEQLKVKGYDSPEIREGLEKMLRGEKTWLDR